MKKSYTHGPGIDEPLAVRDLAANQSYFYIADGLGSITDITDSAGNVVQAYLYDSFGNIVQQAGVIENFYTYTGREYDAESGLYYYRARYYDPGIGRFLQEDPITSVSSYGYAKNNPIGYVDPSGMILEKVFNGPRDENSGRAVSVNQFIDYARQKKLNDLLHENDYSQNATSYSAGGPADDYRYVVDPSNPNQIIDMRHFLVIGRQGELFGLAVEIIQSLGGDTKSAFHAQDFFSNALGSEFFNKHYDSGNENISEQLQRYFSERNC